MTVELTYDLVLELRFLFTGQYPIALMEQIGKQKNEIYSNLSPDIRRPDMLSGSREFSVAGRKFLVLFASDQRQVDRVSDKRPLRVIDVHELEVPEK